MQLIDTHSHLYLKQFKDDLNQVIDNAKAASLEKVLLPNIDISSIQDMHRLVEIDPSFFYPMMGLHPCSVGEDVEQVLEKIKSHLYDSSYIAVGEIGIDLYWDKTFLDQQKWAFAEQIKWAKDLEIPIVIHARESFDEIFEVLDNVNDDRLTGVFHCFTGNLDQAHKALGYGGFKLGLGGVLTYKNSGLDKTVKELDLKDLVLETDSPYLPPVPYRGKRNESAYVKIVAQKLADIKEMDIAKVAEITTENALSLFKLS